MTVRPVQHLASLARDFPNIWRDVDHLVSGRGKDLPKWKDWCFMPLSAAEAIASNRGGNAHDIARIGALAAWRLSQGIYRFDDTLFDSLVETPLTGKIPIEILFRLPEYCLYIETPQFHFIDEFLPGFFVHLEDDQNGGDPELRVLLDSTPVLLPAIVHLKPGSTVADGMRQTFDEARAFGRKTGRDFDIRVTDQELEQASMRLGQLINLVLYICSTDTDMDTEHLHRPIPTKTKAGMRYFPPDKPRITEVGYTLGATIRAAMERETAPYKGGAHASPRPHIRRAHWHSYWTGPKRGELRVRWLHPMLVGADKNILKKIH
jgi:hypothetical protein